MGWSGVLNIRDLPSIWQEFQSTKNKLSNKDNLLKKVKEWSRELGYEVDNGVYLGKKTMEDLINVVMTGGGGSQHLQGFYGRYLEMGATTTKKCSIFERLW